MKKKYGKKQKKSDHRITPWLNGGISRSTHPEVFCKVFFEKLCEIDRKIIVLESLFNGVSGFETCNFIDLILSFVKFL